MVTKSAVTVAVAAIGLGLTAAAASADSALAFATRRARSSIFARPDTRFYNAPEHPLLSLHRAKHQSSRNVHSLHSYRKFHDYAWNKLVPDDDATIDTVPDELKTNASPVKGAPPGTNVVANIRSISQFPSLVAGDGGSDGREVLRLARSAFLETQSPTSEALITPMTIHVLNLVLFPSPHIRDGTGECLGLPIFGADIVSLPGNKHLVALDFQPVLPLSGGEGKEKSSLIPQQYSHLERKLQTIHSKYQRSKSGTTPLLPWGGDIPPQAERFFSPYALWTRLSEEDAMDTVSTVVWEAFQEYTDLYLELMSAVQGDVDAGVLELCSPQEELETNNSNSVLEGQIDYLEYRRTNDPARPMLRRLYGDDWSENVIGKVLFPDLDIVKN